MPTNPRAKPSSDKADQDATAYDAQRIPFDVVLRKLANTKPPHKAAKPACPNPKRG